MSPSRSIARLLYAAMFSLIALAPSVTHGDSSPTVVRVSSESALQAAVQNIQSNTTILIAPGTYRLSATLSIGGAVSNVALRGDSENRDDVVLVGPGMSHASHGLVPYGVVTGSGVDGVTIANLTIRDIYYYAIAFGTGTANPHVDNVHLVDAGAAFIAVNPTGNVPVDEGIIENSLIEYSQTADRSDSNGIDLRGGENWLIRGNVFRNIVGPSLQPAGAAVLAREHAIGTVTDGNRFVNSWQGIAYGVGGDNASDHIGGIIRNNMFFRAASQSGEAGIAITRSPNTLILNNTVFVSGTYGTPIEYRFEESRDLVLANNLLDGAIWARDGATGDELGNVAGAAADLFADVGTGDLHLAATATAVIDRGVPMMASAADVDGELRPAGAAYDVGADEYMPGRVAGAAFRSRATSKTALIAGRVTTANGGGVSGVTVKLSGGRAASDSTDKYGFFWFTSLPGGSDYVVTPSGDGVFTPTSRTYRSASGYVLNANFTKTSSGAGSGSTPNPTVTLTSPSGSTKLVAPAKITMSATANGGGGTITKVEFYAGSTKIGVVTAGGGTYSTTWSNVIAGFYVIKAVATTSSGAVASSQTANVTVDSAAAAPAPTTPTPTTPTPTPTTPTPTTPVVPPSVTLVNPTNGSSANAPASITCMATASAGSEGAVSKVQFYSGSTIIGTSMTAPYSITWTNVPAGSYSLKAVVTNTAGASAASPVVAISVVAASAAPAAPAAPYALTVVNGIGSGTYLSGSTVNISANIPAGQTFAGWAGATVSDPSAATTKLVMPAAATTVTAKFSPSPSTTTPIVTAPVTTGGRLQQGNLVPIGTFTLPHSTLGSDWGFGSYAGCCGLGTYAVTFNPARNSIFIGGHPYEQRIAEIAVPSTFNGGQATALSNLIDPLEGKLSSINPGDPNSKILSSALVYNNQLYLGAYAYYDGSVTQTKSEFVRPVSLTTTGQVIGPVKIGSNYPGWVDKFASLVPAEWQGALGGPAFAGGAGGAINSAQSWGPSVSVFNPTSVAGSSNVAATVVLGYPMDHPLADTMVGNTLWSQADVVTGAVAVPGTSTILFFGKHGMGKYCYGEGSTCGDKDDNSKGTHAYPYRSQVWAYDMNDLVAVRNGQKNSYDVKPYAVWELDPSFHDIQGVAYDPSTKHLFVSQVGGDSYNNQPLIRVYSIQ